MVPFDLNPFCYNFRSSFFLWLVICDSSLIANLSCCEDFLSLSSYGWKLVKTKKVVQFGGFNYLRCLLQFGLYLRVLCVFTFFFSLFFYLMFPLRIGFVQFI